ncbi:transcriptional repressor general negative regulator of transcription subunit 4 [Stygiomarasmius scandens]|uniref:Transcriptional repressor general negative regulator of transcription subunit 4 n=1 Tax=Marasmiellus scandens TaxID=2682957 RepID=A0ABR1J4V5_9AGAR
MTTTRIHHALPAPVVHAGFSVPQSKSHVLAGVQDAYWSDDEAEDADCPLCLEEMDISDLNFKPCVCGYQICRFCWHHIKENLNKRCPACRRIYTDEAVDFKPIATEDHKRLMQQKKQRERERKELDALGRRQLANLRVVQRNVVYVVGIGPRFAKEELIPTLRSSEYFGQYGKINKMYLVKRNPSGGGEPVVGVYITYHRREDAARAIAAVDGSPSPGGGREVMRASYGTTKYCMAFLRGANCSDHGCMNLHEWGDEKDCFTKEDLTTLKHTMKATETRTRTVLTSSKSELEGLPKSAAWGSRPVHVSTSISSSTTRRRGGPSGTSGGVRQSRPTESRPSNVRTQDKKVSKAPSQASSSRPSTPAPLPPASASLPPRPASPAVVSTPPPKQRKVTPPSSESPAPSAVQSEPEAPSSPPETVPPPPSDSVQSSVPSAPPGLPAVPPGLSAPPGLPPPRPSRVSTASPQTPLLAYQTSYQMSNAARALLDDVKARREAPLPAVTQSPFPDFDLTLKNLTGGDGTSGGFTFNLDPKLAGDDANVESLPDFEAEARMPFVGSFTDAFPGLRPGGPVSSAPFMAPPGVSYSHSSSHSMYEPIALRSLTPQSTGSGSNYTGPFNPFADSTEDIPSSSSSPAKHNSLDDDSRKVSRFGFARGRQGTSVASSPLQISSTLSSNSNELIYNHPPPRELHHSPALSQWSMHSRQDLGYGQSNSNMASPLVSHAQVQPAFSQHQPRYQQVDNGISEAQLRDFIQSSRDQARLAGRGSISADVPAHYKVSPGQQQFADPAIMSARFASNAEHSYMPLDHSTMSFGPPPGLPFPQGMPQRAAVVNDGNSNNHESRSEVTADTLVLSSSDFPALSSTVATEATATSPQEGQGDAQEDPESEATLKAQEKAARKAAKKAAAAEKAAERQKIAQEKAAAKAAEKARVAQEKAIEKEKAAALKAQQDKEKAEKEQMEKAKAKAEREKERAARAERERLAQIEREKAAEIEKEKAVKRAVAAAAKAEAQIKREAVSKASSNVKQAPPPPPEPVAQVPLLSKKPKKNKPIAKPIKLPKEEEHAHYESSTISSATPSDAPAPNVKGSAASSNNSRSHSLDRNNNNIPTSIEEFLEDIHTLNPHLNLLNHPFFDLSKINPAAKMPLEYAPLVHALSALSVGGGSFANNVPSGSIDNAVSSFQQLLETLTQTISDLLRLLPRTTWDDSSSFDGVLRDMLKGDDFLDETGEDGHGREDEVAALTLALERRARWMEVQLSKLEELHRDINTAAVRAVLAFNDNGWDRQGFLPRVGNTVKRFDSIGLVEEFVGRGDDDDDDSDEEDEKELGEKRFRPMTADELEEKLITAKEAAVFAETELREAMEKMQRVVPQEEEV